MTVVASIVFWVAAVVGLIGGIGVITARSAIYSALSLILTLSQLAILYLLLNAQFIAAVQILIYAGAIMVLFLFVITLLGVQEHPFVGERLPFQRTLAVIFAALLLFGLVFFVAQSPNALTGAHGTFNAQLAQGNVQAFGTQLFTTFVFPFELTPLLLIVAMIGAVALGRGDRRKRTATGGIDTQRVPEHAGAGGDGSALPAGGASSGSPVPEQVAGYPAGEARLGAAGGGAGVGHPGGGPQGAPRGEGNEL